MNSDKENINRIHQSKNPLPTKKMPASPSNLHKTRRNSESEQRHPLKTINNQHINTTGSAGPSRKSKKVLNTSIYPIKLDTRHVTVRQENDDLDWDYKVFKDSCKEENSVISISDEDDNVEHTVAKQIEYFAGPKQRTHLSEVSVKVTTPTLNNQEPSRVRNIKRSLKRPHSRELQGISPASQQKKRENEKHARRLNFNERLHDRLRSPDSMKQLYMTCLSRDYTCDMFTYLLEIEEKPIAPRIPSVTRACVINWLIKVNGPDGDPSTVQTACCYLDTVLGTGYVRLDKLQLVAAACYWISQKLHGHAAQASRLIKCASGAFTGRELVAAEKEVLLKLKFPRLPVVPEDYITYLSWCCDQSHPGEIEVAATFICLSGLMVNRALCDEYPSVVGAAAVKNALLLLKKRDLQMCLEACPVFKAIEEKAASMSFVCSVQRKAVRLMVVPSYEYKGPFEHYSCGPHYIAQRIVKTAHELVMLDTRIQIYRAGPENWTYIQRDSFPQDIKTSTD